MSTAQDVANSVWLHNSVQKLQKSICGSGGLGIHFLWTSLVSQARSTSLPYASEHVKTQDTRLVNNFGHIGDDEHCNCDIRDMASKTWLHAALLGYTKFEDPNAAA